MRLAILFLLVPSVAAGEPCPLMSPQLEVLSSGHSTPNGGLVVGEVSKMVTTKQAPPRDLTKWKVRTASRTIKAPTLQQAAPGLWIVSAGGEAFQLEDNGAVKGNLRFVRATPSLGPPAIARVVSGETNGKHVNRYVNVELSMPAPAGALAMVLVNAKGTAISWGRAADGAKQVTVYSTESGCVTTFPNGTEIAQPGEKVTAFWVDTAGHKSPASTAITVAKP